MSEHPSPVEPVPQTPSDSETTGVLSFILQAACGVALLLPAFFLIAVAPGGSFLALMIIGMFTPGLNVIWFGVCIALSIYGTRRRMPGITWSPIIFFSLWFLVAVIQRVILATHADAGPAQTADKVALPTDFRDTTLTLLGEGDLTRDYWYYKPLAERKVARIVTGRVFDLRSSSPRAKSITYAEGETCRSAGPNLDRFGTSLLIQAGRLGECFLRYDIKSIPDSLVVQIRDLSGRPPAIDIIVRDSGEDRTLVSQAQRRTFILNYLPMIGSGNSFSFATERFAATDQPRRQGGAEDLTTAHGVVVALFGEVAFTPIPPKPDPRSPEILALASQMLAQQQFKAALNLVTLAKDAGNVTSVTDDVMAAVACSDAGENDRSYWKYLRSRTPDQSLILLRKVFARASDPRHAKDHTGCYGLLPSPDSHQLEFETAAQDLFRQKGLGVWQYEFALVFLARAVQGLTPNSHPPKREDIAAMVFAEDDSVTFVNRAIAFRDQYPKLNDDEMRGLSRRLSIIADDDLDRFENAFRIHNVIETKVGTVPSDTVAQLRQAAKDRAIAIRDRQLRGRFSSWMNPREAR